MNLPQLKIDFIDTTEDHLRGFAHKHAMENRAHSIEHVEGTLWMSRQMLTRESHTLETPDLGAFVFDVTSIKLVLSRRIPPFRMVRANLTQEWADYTFRTCGCEQEGVDRLTLADLDRPGVMVWFGPGRTAQIDGSHRLVRSWREGRTTYDMALVDYKSVLPFTCRPGAEDQLFEVARTLEEHLGMIPKMRGKVIAKGVEKL